MKKYITYMKAIGILLVVLGHINYANETIKTWIYSFHMPLFFFISGLSLKEGPLNLSYINKKIHRLIVPYFIWALFYAEYDLKNLAYILYGSYNSIYAANSLSSLWYLPCLFWALMLSKLIVSKIHNTSNIILVMTLCMLIGIFLPYIDIGYPFCVDVAFIGTAFVLFGYIFERYFLTSKVWLLIVFLVSGILIGFVNHNSIEVESYVAMAIRRIGNPICFIISAFGGCLLIYGVAKLLNMLSISNFIDNIICKVGLNSLTILLVHKPIIELAQKFCENWSNIYQLIFSCIITMVISVVISEGINRFFPFLIGKTESI